MCSPITEISNEIAEIDTENDTNHDYILIDQRQNGSANYRVNIDGVVIAFTPLGSLLSGALDDFDFSDEFDFGKPEKPPGDGQNSTEANAVGASLAGGVETNATVHKNGGKFKR